jgi:hypothetical protein
MVYFSLLEPLGFGSDESKANHSARSDTGRRFSYIFRNIPIIMLVMPEKTLP